MISTKKFVNVLKENVKPWMAVANGHNYFFQKGTGSTYNAKAAMEQCLTDLLEL
jgi:hypothetical protein